LRVVPVVHSLTVESWDDVSSKSASRRRHRAALDKKYRRLRKIGRVPQHTQAERRLAAAEREHQREIELQRERWFRRTTTPVVTVLSGAAVTFGAVAAPGLEHHVQYYSTAAVAPYYPFQQGDSEHPDPPHMPETPPTEYAPWSIVGTANASARVMVAMPAKWKSWEWLGPNVFGD
jgi:hypothetical protein